MVYPIVYDTVFYYCQNAALLKLEGESGLEL
jgi:hypothetical protein